MRIYRIGLVLVIALVAIGWVLPATSARSEVGTENATTLPLPPELLRKLHPSLTKQLLSSPGDNAADLRVQIVMRDQVDVRSLAALSRVALVANLQARADRSQAGVLSVLAQAQLANRAGNVRPLWINNSIAARLDRATVLTIAARDDVALIKLDEYRQWVNPTEFAGQPLDLQSPTSVEWGVARIQADKVWAALNITGTGVVVANMDTGVDWQHPALQASYRGNLGKGLVSHVGNWFDTTDFPTQYPYDAFGHGTHTMGTLVGSGGIGVAPGAKWIAVRVLNNQGYGLYSWIHAGFQWILAPGGDPARAPDVFNNSWGSSIGGDAEFRSDVTLINAAGIFAVFSNGNDGPSVGTVGSPASYPEAFSVGATDQAEFITSFSSRGPSPFGVIKPDLSAPGLKVRSSFAGGGYVIASGTSMAAPHVAGVAALMHSAVPGLSIQATRYALTSTAMRVVSLTYPNNDYGWGRVDALHAVLSVVHPGSISGTITRADNGLPIGDVTVHAESGTGLLAETTTDAAGHYRVYGAAGYYTLTLSAFGYEAQVRPNVFVLTDTVTSRDYALTPLATGTLFGRVTDITGTRLLSATLIVRQSPVKVDVFGTYTVVLPIGTHLIEMRSPEHRVITTTITIEAGKFLQLDFALPDAPSILLIDSGAWYGESQIGYYQQALDDLGYLHTDWTIRDPAIDLPTTPTLRAYDTVIWSAPFDSPGVVGASNVVSDYLSAGGHLLISGQDVAYFDAYWGSGTYLTDQILAQFIADDGPTRVLTGQHSYAGRVVTLTGGDGANNQLYPDVITSSDPFLADTAFEYAAGQSGGQTSGLCRRYRTAYLAYGFESISDAAARRAVMSDSLQWLGHPPITQYYALDPQAEPLIGVAGTRVTRTLQLHNFDEVAPSTTFLLNIDPAWSATITPTHMTLASCRSKVVTVTVDVPAGTAYGTEQPLNIEATPLSVPAAAVSTTLIAKAPGSVLLVDDDRWYAVDAPYREALAAHNISYDLWRVPVSWGGEASAPDADRLSWYPAVIWFTGYDWYDTLTAGNETALRAYWQNGGRFALSSQDYLGQRGYNLFGRDVLGVGAFLGDVQDHMLGGVAPRFDEVPWQPFAPPYPNYSDALVPQPGAQVAMVGTHGWPTALANASTSNKGKAVFMAFGFEGLTTTARLDLMNATVGYLSWLGSSSVSFDRDHARNGDVVTATIAAVNDGPRPIVQAALTVTLPANVSDPDGALTWQGSLLPGQRVTQTLAMTVTNGERVELPVYFEDLDHQLHFTMTARLPLTVPQLDLNVQPAPASVLSREVMTWTVTANNRSSIDRVTTITSVVPFNQSIISTSVQASSGAIEYYTDTLAWNGVISAGQTITLTYQMTAPRTLYTQDYYASAIAVIDNEVRHADAWLNVQPRRAYLPVIRK